MTVNVAVEPSVWAAASATDSVGRLSSSRISTVAWSSPSSALLLGDLRARAGTSRPTSTTLSLISGTDTVLKVSVAAKVSVCKVAAV